VIIFIFIDKFYHFTFINEHFGKNIIVCSLQYKKDHLLFKNSLFYYLLSKYNRKCYIFRHTNISFHLYFIFRNLFIRKVSYRPLLKSFIYSYRILYTFSIFIYNSSLNNSFIKILTLLCFHRPILIKRIASHILKYKITSNNH
jgi:hypothetical protein